MQLLVETAGVTNSINTIDENLEDTTINISLRSVSSSEQQLQYPHFTMKVLIVICVLFAIAQANPQFRALRARASGLAGAPGAPSAPVAPAQPAFGSTFQTQPQFQAQPSYQAQPQYQQYRPQPQYQYQGAAPFGGFQPAQG